MCIRDRANADQLWVRSCALVDEQPNLLADDVREQWRWTVERAALALRGPQFVCYLAEKKAGLDPIAGTMTDGVVVADLRSRAVGHKVTSVVMSDGHEDLDLASTEGRDVTNSSWLTLLAKNEATPKIKRVTALLASGHSVNVDFTDSTASAMTKSQPSLPVFVGGVLPLLRDLSEEEVDGLAGCFETGDEQDLFSLLEATQEGHADDLKPDEADVADDQ